MTVDSTSDLERLRHQQASLRRRARLHWLHRTIVGVSVLVTVLAWHTSSSILERRAARRFEREIGRVVDLVRERMSHYEDALLSGVASIHANGGTVTRARWRRYAEHLQLTERYPGIGGIGVIFHLSRDEIDGFVERARQDKPDFEIHPEHELDFRLPIVYIEPEADNAAAVGLDVAFEHDRRTAALRARRLGTIQISGPIVLVQDATKTPGFLLYAPYYGAKDGRAPGSGVSPRFREASFRGLVYAPLVVRSLVAGTLDVEGRDVQFSIRDGDDVLYEESDESDGDVGAEHWPYASTRAVDMYGRTWTFDFRGTGAAPGERGVNQPLVVLVSGLAIDGMLLVLFALTSRSNRQILSLAEELTGDLLRHALALAESNDELTDYAHVLSHDLKTPIRGIQDLTDFIREDLEGYLASNDANPEVGFNLERLSRQAMKGQALIASMLDYSSVGVVEEAPSIVDVRKLIEEIGASLGVRPEQLVFDVDLPTFETRAVRLRQVFENLIGNAFRYHHDREHARVHVSVTRDGEFHRFAVTDDGPGIESRYHERIFKAFTRLEAAHDVDSSGIGLSIVKKSVERLGGGVSVESRPRHGTTFRFDWPAANVRRAA